MPAALLILHLIGLMIGFAGAVGGTALLAQARPVQKQKGGPARGAGANFARMATLGFLLTAGTGVGLAATGDPIDLASAMVWMKLAFTGLLGFATFSIEVVYDRARRRDPNAPRLLPSLWPLAIIGWLVAVVFSVLAVATP